MRFDLFGKTASWLDAATADDNNDLDRLKPLNAWPLSIRCLTSYSSPCLPEQYATIFSHLPLLSRYDGDASVLCRCFVFLSIYILTFRQFLPPTFHSYLRTLSVFNADKVT